MELGGNIRLEGFGEMSPAELVIVKKLVGSYVKEISEMNEQFKQFTVILKSAEMNNFELEALLHLDKEYRSEAKEQNLFFGLNNVFKGLKEQL